MPLDGFGDFAQGSLYIPPRVIFQTQAQSQRVLKIGFHIFRGGLDFRVDAQSIQGQQRFKVMVYRENSCIAGLSSKAQLRTRRLHQRRDHTPRPA